MCYCACAETPLNLLPVSKWTSNSDSSCRKTYKHEKLGHQTAFYGHFPPFFVILSLRMRRNITKSTFGFKMHLKFGFLMPKNIYAREMRPPNCSLRAFSVVFREFVTAHAQKHH